MGTTKDRGTKGHTPRDRRECRKDIGSHESRS